MRKGDCYRWSVAMYIGWRITLKVLFLRTEKFILEFIILEFLEIGLFFEVKSFFHFSNDEPLAIIMLDLQKRSVSSSNEVRVFQRPQIANSLLDGKWTDIIDKARVFSTGRNYLSPFEFSGLEQQEGFFSTSTLGGRFLQIVPVAQWNSVLLIKGWTRNESSKCVDIRKKELRY